jgi:nucleotide-binding universal stress UspA family protein
MYKTILIPLDGSRRAEHALEHAEQLALSHEVSLFLIRVVTPPKITDVENSPFEVFQKLLDERIREAQNYLDSLKGKLEEKHFKVESKVVFGSVVKEILDAAERIKADLIVMCSHGRTGLSRLFYGSVASGILNRVDRPLLVVRSRKVNH